jgi:N-acetyl-beta-hexosaminidase
MTYPNDWTLRGICITAPKPADVELFVRFINERLAGDGLNTLVLLTRYRYAFESHPECRGNDPLSKSDVAAIKAACDGNGIELIPKMNLLGHQSGRTRETLDGLLRGFPQFDETPDRDEVEYCRSLCPTDPECLKVVLDLVGEMADAFGAKTFHIGCDEVFEIARCPRCREKSTAELFCGWVSAIHDFLASKGIRTMMWGDRLLDDAATGYGRWEASQNGTAPALDHLPKDILICDWHYEDLEAYPSVEIFARAGFETILCPWRILENTVKFIEYAKAHDGGNIRGVMATTWCDTVGLIKALLQIPDDKQYVWDTHIRVAETYRALFMQ